MAFETELTKKSREYVEKYLHENFNEQLYYHNFKHLQDVAAAALEIGQATELTQDQLETVIIAAWFHDTGYSKGWENHEFTSKNLASEFLRSLGVDEKKIADIGGCIIATKMPQRPTNIMEEVLCDADLNHVASEEFFTKSEMLRREISARNETNIKKLKWFKESLEFLKKSEYFTPYAREKLLPAKEQNLNKLKSLVKQIKEKKKSKDDYQLTGDEKVLTGMPGRGVETLFRITSKNHIDFSSMADNKANIMISINSILISILFSVLFSKFEEYPNLIFPSMVLALTCLTTMVFAILATRPGLANGIYSREEFEKRKTNLLFFGNFYNMPISEYEWGMKQIISDNDFLYSSLIRDIYYLGKVLGRKYKYLRISYTVFMFGFIFSVIAFTLWIFYFRSVSI
jgi:predicted metal-dependent HD superfamily phosphohydrolase